MAKKIFHKQYGVSVPALLLQNRNFETIGSINNIHNFIYKENYNGANELSFSVYKKENGCENPLWDSLTDFKIIYIPEFEERFEINTSVTSGNSVIKSVTAASLCESELSQTMLYDIEINTETDILNTNYDVNFPTVFYRDPEDFHSYDWSNDKYRDYTDDKKREVLKQSSLLHRILEKAEHYSIGSIDSSLKNIQREFSISGTDLYSVLTGEIAEEFHCIFLFDSMTRTISAHDLYNTCKKCGYRGDFSDKCPECGSEEFGGQYGKDTTVFISTENLAQEISLETNKDSLKNCFYVEGGDDIITSAVRSVNPNGTNYIYEYNDETKADMPEELSSTITAYDKLYQEYITQKTFPLDSAAVDDYNRVVDEINRLFEEDDSINFLQVEQTLTGFPAVTKVIYEATDLYQFVNNSMMPTIHIDGLGLEESLTNIINGFSDGFSMIKDDGTTEKYFQNQIALRNHTTATQRTMENAIKKSARLYYSRAYYDLEIHTASYAQATENGPGRWLGTFTLTSLTETDSHGVPKLLTSEPISLEITDNAELYVEQAIYRKVGEIEKSKYGEITSLNMDFDTFQEKIRRYSFHELERLRECFQACLDIIITADIFDETLYEKYYTFYKQRFDQIDLEELPERESQLNCVRKLYYYDSSEYETSGLLYEIKKEVNRTLNFKEYLLSNPLSCESYPGAGLWKTFCAYRREDKYTNSNYISDGLVNADIIAKAQSLFDTAKKELYKAANLQVTLSANLNNLLAMEEFQPLADSFSCGNWIRVEIEGQIYRLRLLSYQISYDDLPSLEVEFSTVEKLWCGDSDIKSILDSAKSMASSYSYTVQQVNNSAKTSKQVENWVEKGLDATAAKIVNSADNQDIVIDRNGILCRKYDDLKESYGRYQMRIISNGAYLYDTATDTVKTGIGEFLYPNPEDNFKETVGYGVIADTVVGSLILGKNLAIYNTNGSLRFDGSGLSITNNENTVSINPNNNEKLIRITNSKGEDVFYTNDIGNLTMSGTIVGSQFIGGQINIGKDNFIVDPEGNVFSNGTITSNGAVSFANGGLTYNDADGLKVRGTITAESGSKIGNLSINNNRLTYGNFGIDTSSTNSGNIALWLGNTNPSSAPFRVTYDGKLYAKNGDFSGSIDTTSGKIGGFTIGKNAIYNGTNSMTSNEVGIYLGIDGIRSYGNHTHPGVKNYVDITQGELTCSVANVRVLDARHIEMDGIGAMSVSSGALNIDTGVYSHYLAIGGRSADGKHEIDTVTFPSDIEVSIHDGLTVGKNLNIKGKYLLFPAYGNPADIYPAIYNDETNGYTYFGSGANDANGQGSSMETFVRGFNVHLYSTTSGGGVYLGKSGSTAVTSDENFKILTNIDERYENFFYSLKPTLYKYKTGHRKHIGFGARAVEQALKDSALENEEFAGLVIQKDVNLPEDYSMDSDGNTHFDEIYSLRYEEFISLNTLMTQKALIKMKEQGADIQSLKNENEKLKSEIKTIKEQLNTILK
ncbi:MAG: hypothetical protein HFG80_07680 [Eubacterium sp.]|nr:hypothetical protein [Eubacterium sp.]